MNPAARLASLVSDCATSGVSRRAMLLRADRLARPHHLRLAEAALAPLLLADRAQTFRLAGPRIAIVWRGDAEDAVLQAVTSLQTLLQDAPSDAPALADLVALYDLPEAGDMLLAEIEPSRPVPAEPAGLPAAAIDAATLDMLETALSQADLSRFVRRRMVWQLPAAKAAPKPAWDHRFLDMRDLAAELTPGHDLQADPALFRQLARTLDRRMLSLLGVPGELAAAGPFGLNLTIASMLSPEFLRFDDILPARLRGGVVLAITAADILADPAAFVFARGFLRARRYRVLLRGFTPALADLLAWPVLDLDHYQMPWSASLPDTAGDILDHGSGRLVLSRANEPAAIAWTRSHGIGFAHGAALPLPPSVRLVHPPLR